VPTFSSGATDAPSEGNLFPARIPRRFLNAVGRVLLGLTNTIHGLGAFILISLGVALTKSGLAPRVIRPLIRSQIYRAGVRLLPMVGFLGFALGFVVIGQTVSLLSRVGATKYAGLIMVSSIVRELGPLATTLLVLARVGTATVIELGTSRAMGEVEALEALAIDPIHYLVVPRLAGIAVAVSGLTVYLILVALISGYLFAFVQDVPLRPEDYFGQIAAALSWEDFVLLGIKTISFGIIIAAVTCYHGLAQPLRLEEVSGAATSAVMQSVVACIILDAIFITVYLVM